MTFHELNQSYFAWMCQLVSNERYSKRLSYRKLLTHLHEVEFTYTLPMDGNRAEDGIDLRYRFGYENDYSEPMIASGLDDRPCSVLEMMIALSMRCEEQIILLSILIFPEKMEKSRLRKILRKQVSGRRHMQSSVRAELGFICIIFILATLQSSVESMTTILK